MKCSFLAVAFLTSFHITSLAWQDSMFLLPTSDGSLYTCDECNVVSDSAYVLASGYIQGAVKFSSTFVPTPVSRASFSLNPYGLPLLGTEISIYGYGTEIGSLDATDASRGILIGVYPLPSNLGYGEDVQFDVTDFLANTVAPYWAFNIRSEGTMVFSSLEYNYGNPARLHITTVVPEPSVLQLFAIGLLTVGLRRRSVRRYN